uniref:Uncharacterized protein n=1 Tax=Rhizophora mucronata TaxID=61149 RepID=A0A2P2P1P7_RHIMU
MSKGRSCCSEDIVGKQEEEKESSE